MAGRGSFFAAGRLSYSWGGREPRTRFKTPTVERFGVRRVSVEAESSQWEAIAAALVAEGTRAWKPASYILVPLWTRMASFAHGWTEITLGGHCCHIFEPRQPNPHAFVVVYLHGVEMGTPRDVPEFTPAFDRHGLRVIGPVTRRSWWSDRICPEFDEHTSAEKFVRKDVLELVRQRWQSEPPRIALLGSSMGGQGALRLSYKYPDTFPTVAALSPAIDFQLRLAAGDEMLRRMYRDEEDARQDTATLHIHPLNWPRNQWFCCDPTDDDWFDSAERLRMKLFSLGVPHSCDLETIGGGHGVAYQATMAERAVDFLAHALEQERLRVV